MNKLIPMVLALVLVFALTACGGASEEAPETQAAPAVQKEPPVGGSVYFLNAQPEADALWQALAENYTAGTGTAVRVRSVPAGSYGTVLSDEMTKEEVPTLFQCGSALELARWEDHTLPLEATGLIQEMTTEHFNLKNEKGETRAMGISCQAFGILVNKTLLSEAGYTVEEIRDFASLKAIADDIHARAARLGFDAFTASGLEKTSAWRFSSHLISIPLHYEFVQNDVTGQPAAIQGTFLDNLRQLWDLYLTDTAGDPRALLTITGEQSAAEFREGRAVFHQTGTWAYPELIGAGMTADQLALIPLYCGIAGEEEAGLAWGTENCLAINARASEEDIQATIDFLKWVVTSQEGTSALAEQFGAIPFPNPLGAQPAFLDAAQRTKPEGKPPVSWAFQYAPNGDAWQATIVTALAAYAADPTDAVWRQVAASFVDGWAYEYAMQQG